MLHFFRLELNDFPLDVQELGIQITTERSKNEVLFEINKEHESAINTRTFQAKQEWNLYSNMNIVNFFISDIWKGYKRPVYKISCKISRKPGYYLNNVFMLVFVISVLGFVPFSCDVNYPQYRSKIFYIHLNSNILFLTCFFIINQVPINLILLLSSINFRWVVTQRLPPISYLTILDKYVLSGLLFLALLAFWHACIGSDMFTKDSKRKIDQTMLFIVTSFFIFFHIIFILIFFFKYSLIQKLEEKHKNRVSAAPI